MWAVARSTHGSLRKGSSSSLTRRWKECASSEPYALLNAQTIRRALGTDWALAETGASGPTGNRYGDSSGHACFAASGMVEKVITLETGDTDRAKNMWVFAKRGLDLLIECLNEAK